jgi:parvulin-like peptidyl-prolyl isomerase
MGIGLVIAGAAIGAMKLRNERPIVVINGEKISRSRFMTELEASQGASVLRHMIQEKLVMQEAARKGVLPSPAQVQAEIANLREAQPDFDRQLRLSGKTKEELEENIRERLAEANLIAARVKLTDPEIKQVWAAHQKEFSHPEGRKIAMIVTKSAEIGDKARRSMEAGAEAAIAAQNPGMALPGGQSQLNVYRGLLPAAVEKEIFALKTGHVSAVLPAGKVFLVVKVLDQIPAHQKSYDEVKDRLLLALKLRKGMSEPELIQSLQKEARIEFKSDRYKGLADMALATPAPRSTRLARAGLRHSAALLLGAGSAPAPLLSPPQSAPRHCHVTSFVTAPSSTHKAVSLLPYPPRPYLIGGWS